MKKTLIHELVSWANDRPNDPALATKVDGNWESLSTREYVKNLYHFALFLKGQGFGDSDVALVMSRNGPEWVQSELGVILAGGICGGLYQNASAEDLGYAISLTNPKLICVQNKEIFYHLKNSAPSQLEKVESIVVFEGRADFDPRALSFKEACRRGETLVSGNLSLERLLEQLDPERGAFLIFTSGTTGKPKAALVSNTNLFFSADCYKRRWTPPKDGKLYSFLPAAHIAEKVYTLGHGIHFRYPVYFAESIFNILSDIQQVQPVAFLATPRIWEKMMDKAQRRIRDEVPAWKQRLFSLAQSIGHDAFYEHIQGKRIAFYKYWLWRLLDRYVMGPMRMKLGLSKTIKNVSGAAALPSKVRRWFRGIGIEILEAYAQTESSGILAGTTTCVDSMGSVGFPLPQTECMIAQDGEILTKGPHVFVGYLNNPEATKSVLRDGWLHTGDLGSWTDDGQIRLIGRKKDIIKPAEGKIVAPMKIEQKIMASPLVSQAVVFGDGKKHLVALITANPEYAEVLKWSDIFKQIRLHLADVNTELARFERVMKFEVLKADFSLERGEITPTLKPRRHIIQRNFAQNLARLYGEEIHEPKPLDESAQPQM